jgi:hypothetical protein
MATVMAAVMAADMAADMASTPSVTATVKLYIKEKEKCIYNFVSRFRAALRRDDISLTRRHCAPKIPVIYLLKIKQKDLYTRA